MCRKKLNPIAEQVAEEVADTGGKVVKEAMIMKKCISAKGEGVTMEVDPSGRP